MKIFSKTSPTYRLLLTLATGKHLSKIGRSRILQFGYLSLHTDEIGEQIASPHQLAPYPIPGVHCVRWTGTLSSWNPFRPTLRSTIFAKIVAHCGVWQLTNTLHNSYDGRWNIEKVCCELVALKNLEEYKECFSVDFSLCCRRLSKNYW